MAETNKRTIRLSGLGQSLDDKIQDLRDIGTTARSAEERAEIERLAGLLESARDECRALCRAWSRSFDVYE
jgi:hypothetical protein